MKKKAEFLLLLNSQKFITFIMRRRNFFIPLTTGSIFLTLYVRDFPSSLFSPYIFSVIASMLAYVTNVKNFQFSIFKFSIFLNFQFTSSLQRFKQFYSIYSKTYFAMFLFKIFFTTALQTTPAKLFIYNVLCFRIPCFI